MSLGIFHIFRPKLPDIACVVIKGCDPKGDMGRKQNPSGCFKSPAG